MAKKKSVIKKKISYKKQKDKKSRKNYRKKNLLEINRKKYTALNNMITVAAITVIAYLLFRVTTNELLSNFFNLLAWIFGFLALTFFITFLVYLFIQLLREKK